MTVISNPSHAMFFNGISDAVIIPNTVYSASGGNLPTGEKSFGNIHMTGIREGNPVPTLPLDAFTLEAWVIPDQGGKVIEYENLFVLSVGSVSSAAPARFEVRLNNDVAGSSEDVVLSSASPVLGEGGTVSYFDGATYPRAAIDAHDSYSPFTASKDDVTGLNLGHRELLQLTVIFDGFRLTLKINGDIVASRTFTERRALQVNDGRIFLGGRGGEFRGTIEAIHWSRGAAQTASAPYAPVKSDATIGLWRFEEPVSPVSTTVALPTVSASTSASSINVGTTVAQTLVDLITGQSGLTSVDLTASPYSNGNYKTARYHAGVNQVVNIPHVPYNLLINPLGYSTTTGKVSTDPPERVRLTAVNASAGTITVESVHLDYVNQPADGRRGLLHARSVTSVAVLVSGDCLIDGGTGEPYQPEGTSTQFSYRSGQVIVDESDNENHGIVFSLGMATDQTDSFNKFAANFGAVDTRFKMGHTARHTLNHVDGHPFMGVLPNPTSEIVRQQSDGISDSFTVSFPDQYQDVRDQLPVNSQVSLYNEQRPQSVHTIISSSAAFTAVENGMAGIDDSKRALIAIGGAGSATTRGETSFDAQPFILKSMNGESPEDGSDGYKRHLSPSITSRIAILEVPSLAGEGYAPFVQVYYNAIDFTGNTVKHAASARLTAGIGGSGTVLTCQSVEAFGKNGQVLSARDITIGGTAAVTADSNITATLNHSAKTITFSSAAASGFQTAAVSGAVVQHSLSGPVLLVEKTVPDVSTTLPSGSQVIDLIHTDLNTAATDTLLHAPGGIITIDPDASFDIESGILSGDDAEGVDYEYDLDLSLTPENHMPFTATDDGQGNPIGVSSANVNDANRPSVFHKLIVSPSGKEASKSSIDTDGIYIEKEAQGKPTLTRVYSRYEQSASATAVDVEGASAATEFTTGMKVYLADDTLIGTLTGVTTKTLTFGAGTSAAIPAGAELFPRGIHQGRLSTNQNTAVHEVFDVIDNVRRNGLVQLYVQPSDRRRHSQLSRLFSKSDSPNPNNVSVAYLMSRGRVISFGDSEMLCHGLTSDIAGNLVDVQGAGSPDSHLVKEIMPGAPVVTVTLGGPGQGAVNTKATWDPSPLARPGWNTRRNGGTRVTSTTSTTIVVAPLNNESSALASWGTYGFPKTGRVYLEMPTDNSTDKPRFASAEYTSKNGTTFTFASGTGHTGTGTFMLANGQESDSLSAWITATGIVASDILRVDDKFSTETICNDGTTVNDRLFQTLDSVQHDYQLGTQYASTRAMVEIPLFEEFFFDDPERGIFPGPDNSMKVHVDCTHTAHTWSPNPVGRRADDVNPEDPEVHSAYSYDIALDQHRRGTVVTQPYDKANRRVYVQEADIFPIPTVAATTVGGIDNCMRPRRAYLPSGEWVLYSARDTSNDYLTVAGSATDGDEWAFSTNFLRELKVGASLSPAPGFQDTNLEAIADNPLLDSAGYEGRRGFYYDRANTMTQGGNVDYGLKQYVSAVEFRAGPRANPHLERIQSGRARAKVVNWNSSSNTLTLDDASLFPNERPGSHYEFRLAYYDGSNIRYAHYDDMDGKNHVVVTPGTSWNPSAGTEIILWDINSRTSGRYPLSPGDETGIFLNRSWGFPYAPGGLRNGDTVWMNMHYTNPHAIEGMFCKSRGTLNEAKVWKGFNGGEGEFDGDPRDSIPMENFLIGNNCVETAKNFVQHVNKTIELNYEALGLSAGASVVAYLDPYQSTEEFARVLLYDVAHDREFIAFQDLWMQVQSSPATTEIGKQESGYTGAIVNTDTNSGERLDVAAGFPSQNRFLTASTKSEFMESAYSHYSTYNAAGTLHAHTPVTDGCLGDGSLPRTNEAVACISSANVKHLYMDETATRAQSTFFDTPDGTRCIPAFLALKGIRNTTLDLASHAESRLQQLKHWTEMDFTRRLTVDFGEVGVKEGVTDIEAAAREVVRLINQAGAKNGRTHARRPADQYLGESERLDLTSVGVKADSTNRNKDPTAPHQHADFAATGSTHDPASFWDAQTAFASHDRGTHMGYVRAHLGRVVLDSSGNKGYSIIIHSTIPGASGRNFCAWLDNSRGQVPYQPQFLIGHGGRFRNYWCQPDEVTGENMHPAPMPINRHGRPFAPITTLKEMIPVEEISEPYRNNLNIGADFNGTNTNAETLNANLPSGRHANTVHNESFESKGPTSVMVDGLRIGTQAKARINFGGFTQAGYPGWAPDAKKWGHARDGEGTRFSHIYGSNTQSAATLTSTSDVNQPYGYIPTENIRPDSIGDGQIYGIRFVDHRGKTHTIRTLYREYGQPFANDKTTLPPTLDDEIIIHFDDRDVGQGGFTIGRHMVGAGDVCGEFTGGTVRAFKGNLWQTYPSPAVGIDANLIITGSAGAYKLEVTLADPYHNGGTFSHSDVLGYLGFPDEGLIQFNDVAGPGNNGITMYYTSRSHYGKSGDSSNKHYFYGLSAGSSSLAALNSAQDRFISPRINWTSLLTDEVIAAAVEYAITMDDPNSESIEATSFDCTSMLAADGKTLGEWGVSPTAIRVKAHSKKHKVLPLRHLFDVTRTPDWGLQAGAAEDTVIASKHTGGLSDAERTLGTRLDVGYIPRTILNISTKYRGSNANTATPILVDSNNNVVGTTEWQQHLRGDKYRRLPGDHIIPAVMNPMVEIDGNVGTASTTRTVTLNAGQLWLFSTPASNDSDSWGEKVTAWVDDLDWALVRSEAGTNSKTELTWDTAEESSDFNAKADPGANNVKILSRYAKVGSAFKVDGIRRAGSKRSSPFLYFRGGQDSPDHWVPLYFGGGFSGVVMDINDGTQNDYNEFYKHPYAAGPTGSAGLQNIGEVANSYALLDTNAMMAMFPGTPYLTQHRGMNNPPFFNQSGLLSFDMDRGANNSASRTGVTYTGGGLTVNCTRPSPIVLRFSHAHARYSASGSTSDHTTYMIFGPGQSIPHNFTSFEPQGSNIVTTGNGYSAVPIVRADGGESYLPNLLPHGGANKGGFMAYLPPSASFQRGNAKGYNFQMNWEPAYGFPNSLINATYGYNQTAGEGMYFHGPDFTGSKKIPQYGQLMSITVNNFAGQTIGSSALVTTRTSSMQWHMEGGYHPGGHFLDNHVSKNPKHPVDAGRLNTGSAAAHNTSSFRVAAQLATAYLSTFDSAAEMTTNADFIVVDATRCENAEELGAVLSASINTFPGSDPLKAIGGTFLPSFQTGTNQDRYGWVEYTLDHAGTGYTAATGSAAATVKVTATIASTLPDYGWLRLSSGTKSAMASYVSFSSSTFTLGTNTLTSNTNAVDPETELAINKADFNDADVRVYVWTKAGTHRHNNTSNSARDHMCQVHFNGLADAVDRTKPIGAVGWHGEAYSYFNSYTANTSFGTNKHPAGLGAWHPFLGFSPYGSADTCLAQSTPVSGADASTAMANLHCTTGLSSRHLVAVSHESELPLIAKADRDGIVCMGDWLYAKQGSTLAEAGTTQWDTAKTSNKSRYVGPATGGPNVEAMFFQETALPSTVDTYSDSGAPAEEATNHFHAADYATLVNMTPCMAPTGDLFWDESVVPASRFHERFSTYGKSCQGIVSRTALNAADAGGLFDFYNPISAAQNFTVENVVWKRMDGGNLTMPAPNARGLGMIPLTTKKSGGSYYTVGEEILGNCRFSFESTNSAMFPIIQAQELAHPQIAEQHPFEVRNALAIPNEEVQFDDLPVTDDTGQTHTLVGGSPFGTIIYDFRHVSDREVEGLAPSIAGSGISPNMKIRLPNPDEIPGNIIVRPGFDRIQAYQNETMGSGGLQHPSQSMQGLQDAFTDSKPGPRLWPFWENNGWEHISQDGTDLSTTKSTSRLAFPDSTNQGWADHTGNAPLQTAYEPHDRTLYFHVTRMGHSMTHRYDVNELTYSSHEGTVITATTAPSDAVWKDTTELSGGRYFLRVYDPTTNEGVIASYTNTSGSTFTGVVYEPDFETFVTGKTGLKIVPSYYVPAGSNRFFASRRLRDHSEYSGNSPDMTNIDWSSIAATPYTQLTAPKMTPMPIPRMGHHYVTPTMAMMPGHYAHPAYQRVYDLHHACRSAQHGTLEEDNAGANIADSVPGRDPLIWFSGPTATYGPSDIHGGAFTLMTETKVRYEGYGIAASEGAAGTTNSQGGHSIVLEATGAYTLKSHFPDPMEVGAYQIVIQPNLFKQQLSGFHRNHSDATKGPAESGSLVTELTGQQVNTVIGIEHDSSNANGAYTLVLAESTMADVRGCEIIINEVMLDMDPDVGSQFTNIPALGLNNPFGTNETVSPPLTRRSLPYQPNAFVTATPGYTMTVPWWSHLHKDGATSASATAFLQLEWFKPDNYYELCRTTYGAIGGQITMGGYPSSFLDIYEAHKRNRSLNPGCVVISSNQGGSTITVDNNDLFPVVPYYGQLIEYVDATGIRRTASYGNRTGTLAYATLGASTTFSSVTGNAEFWSNLAVGTTLRLTGPYDTWASGKILTDSKRSMTPRILPQTLSGTRDTNSLHSPDAFLCLWHPNLGRPFTWYSDDASRSFYTKAGTADTPVLKTALNVLPEHFETIHYHDFFYTASKGPFGLGMKALSPPVGAATSDGDGAVYTAAAPGGSAVATATVTCADGDAAHGLTAGQKIHIISTDGTQKDYFVSDTGDGGVTHLAAVTAGATLKGAGGITASLTSGATGIAVGFDLSTSLTQNAFLVLLKAAIEHANGHNGKITVSAVPGAADGAQNITLTQALAGTAGNTTITEDLATISKANFTNGTTHAHQGGTTSGGTKYNFGGFWPGGSRGGAGVSRLDGFGETLIGWGNQTFGIDCVGYRDNSGVEERTYAQMTSDSEFARQHCFGYRFSVRQPYNRPRWGPAVRGYLELANANALLGYYHGPFVQQDNKTNGWDYVGSDSAQSDATFPATYVGILERLTQVTSLLNEDQLGRQVRYSDGRRITRPFGCPVRNLANANTTVRPLFAGDSMRGIGTADLHELATAHMWYMVDWWGNTRGEDVRRFPARGFGIRPAWDPEDAYTDGGVSNAPSGLFISGKNDIQSGNSNTANNDTAAMATVDWFNPSNAMRVGDRGDGRGVRWPTLFNESLLHDISTPVAATGMLMSHNTAEPNFGQGYIRPRNDNLQNTEVKRGISSRLGVADGDGLLKPEANVGEGVESMVGSFSAGLENLADPVARTGPRIGLDADTIGELTSGVQRDYVGISTQAYSLHTDREVGQRLSLRGAMQGGSRTIGDFDLTGLNWSAQPKAAVVRMSNAHAMWPLGGTYILEARNYAEAFDDTGWGQQITQSGLQLWLKADTLDLDDGGAVTSWPDSSGNGRNFTQGTSSKQPSYVASESDFNNKPAVRFDGGDKLELAFDANLNSNEFTIFFVGAVNNDNNANQLGYESRSSSPVTRSGFNLYADMTGSNNQWEFWAGANSSWKALKTDTGSITVNTPNIITMQISGGDGAGAAATQLLRVDGVQVGTQSANFYKSTSDAQNIGTLNTSSAPFIGEIAEILHYNRALSAFEMLQVEGYLESKYGVAASSAWNSSNPYQTNSEYNPKLGRTNTSDKSVRFLMRPNRVLDSRHISLFRHTPAVKAAAPQKASSTNYLNNFYRSTAGGKYGLFTYHTPSGVTHATPTSAPYSPVYYVDPTTSTIQPISDGPKIPGADATGFDNTSIRQTVGRMVMSENTLEHFRSDAPRRRVESDDDKESRPDYAVEPRYSQSLHPKGEDATTSFNSGDHSND